MISTGAPASVSCPAVPCKNAENVQGQTDPNSTKSLVDCGACQDLWAAGEGMEHQTLVYYRQQCAWWGLWYGAVCLNLIFIPVRQKNFVQSWICLRGSFHQGLSSSGVGGLQNNPGCTATGMGNKCTDVCMFAWKLKEQSQVPSVYQQLSAMEHACRRDEVDYGTRLVTKSFRIVITCQLAVQTLRSFYDCWKPGRLLLLPSCRMLKDMSCSWAVMVGRKLLSDTGQSWISTNPWGLVPQKNCSPTTTIVLSVPSDSTLPQLGSDSRAWEPWQW